MAINSSATLDDLLIQLRIMNRLLIAQVKNELKQNEIISLLASAGASNKEIADVLDTTPATVSTTLTRLRKKQKSK